MVDPKELRRAIFDHLSSVIDPETGVDVVRMRLIEDLVVDELGNVSYTFHPSSPLCPIAVPLSHNISLAVSEVPGVISQEIKVVGYVQAEELMFWLKQALGKPGNPSIHKMQ